MNKDKKKAIHEMAEIIKHTERLAWNVVGASPSQKMIATDLYNKGYRKQSEVAREIFADIQACLIQRHWNGLDIVSFELDAVKYAELKKKYLPDTNDGDKVSSHDICVVCGESVPEGRQVCGMCEIGTGALNKYKLNKYNKNNNQGG